MLEDVPPPADDEEEGPTMKATAALQAAGQSSWLDLQSSAAESFVEAWNDLMAHIDAQSTALAA